METFGGLFLLCIDKESAQFHIITSWKVDPLALQALHGLSSVGSIK